MLGTVSREAGREYVEYVEHGLATLLSALLSALSQGSKNTVYVPSDTTNECSNICASGLVVKFNVAIVEPRVRFSAGAFIFCFACPECPFGIGMG